LRATHAASSPWWAWPFDLKPVWFYLARLSGSTAIIYDAGNLVLLRVSVPPWLDHLDRGGGLCAALVVIGFACQWLPGRASTERPSVHYYTTLPSSCWPWVLPAGCGTVLGANVAAGPCGAATDRGTGAAVLRAHSARCPAWGR
jgi:hypothetical protein